MSVNKILVVEDSQLLHRMYDVIFVKHKQNGGDIIHAFNGRDGLDKLIQEPDTDLVILDVNMPEMNGIEFLNRMKKMEMFKKTPVIIISTMGKEEDTLKGLEAGATAYLTKPFHPNELHGLIQKIVENGQPGSGRFPEHG